MFSGCDRFDCDLSRWDVSNVTYMNGIFSFCYKFEGKGVENWDVSAVNSMYAMFYNCKNFNADLSQWNVSNVTDMKSTFDGCSRFTGEGLEYWDVSKVKDMHRMFADCDDFDCDLSNWDLTKIKNYLKEGIFHFSGITKNHYPKLI